MERMTILSLHPPPAVSAGAIELVINYDVKQISGHSAQVYISCVVNLTEKDLKF